MEELDVSIEYGVQRTFGTTTYGVSGCSSHDEALESVYHRALENGDWTPRKLRERWWQVWRPTKHSDFELKFMQ